MGEFDLTLAAHATIVEAGQAAFTGFFVLVAQVQAGFIHGLDHDIKADASGTVQEVSQVTSVHSTHSSNGISFDAGDLHQTADGVAGQTQVMLHSHFSGILHLLQTQTVQLSQCSSSHGTSRANLSLAAALGAGNGGIVLDQCADDTSGGQTAEDLIVGQVAGLLHIAQNCRQNTAGTTGGCSDDNAVVGILLGHSESVGADLAALTDLGNFGGQLLIVQVLSLTLYAQATGQGAGGLQTVLNGLFHSVPNFTQEVPNFGAFVQFHIVAEAMQVAPLAEVMDLCKGVLGVNVFTFHIGAAQDADITAAHGFHTHLPISLPSW